MLEEQKDILIREMRELFSNEQNKKVPIYNFSQLLNKLGKYGEIYLDDGVYFITSDIEYINFPNYNIKEEEIEDLISFIEKYYETLVFAGAYEVDALIFLSKIPLQGDNACVIGSGFNHGVTEIISLKDIPKDTIGVLIIAEND